MKSTEIFVEQLLIGALVGITICLAFGEWHFWVGLLGAGATSGAAAWISGGLGLGAAYLLGVLMDRFADSLLGPLQKVQRLRFGIAVAPTHPSRWQPRFDPFDQGRLEVAIRARGGDLGDWLQYLRSRIRLARALAVFLPALTVAIVLALKPSPAAWLPWVLPCGYLLAAVGNLFISRVPSTRGKRERIARYFDARRDSEGRLSKASLVLDVVSCPVVRLGLVLLLTAFVLAWGSARLVGVALAGVAASALAGWTWWRITKTLMRFLKRTEGAI